MCKALLLEALIAFLLTVMNVDSQVVAGLSEHWRIQIQLDAVQMLGISDAFDVIGPLPLDGRLRL